MTMKICEECGTKAEHIKQIQCYECDEPYETPLFEAGQGTQSMRSNPFSELTAYCEVIDNSIEAGAGNVKMKIDHDGKKIIAVAFGDDGKGMDRKTLKKCLSIGGTTRGGNQSEEGLGRFGVGMKFAAWNQCERCSVWSKTEDGEWLHIYGDLTEIKHYTTYQGLPPPVAQEPPPQYANLVGKNHGTLVLWELYDGLKMPLSRLQNEAPKHLGRTYRYFIWNEGPDGEPIPGRSKPLRLFFDGQEVHALDPLYHRTEKTRFPDDPQSTLYPTMTIPWPVDVDNIEVKPGDPPPPEESTIRIRFSLLPEEWRPATGAGKNTAFLGPRGVDKESNGFSILRNYREVFFGEPDLRVWKATPPKGWNRFEDVDRWWGCEILFDAYLDNSFHVSNIKGASPRDELRETIKTQILPSRKTANEDVDIVWQKEKERKRKEQQIAEEEEADRRRHAEAERVARLTPGPLQQAGEGKDPVEHDEDWLKKRADYLEKEEAAKKRKIFEAQPYSIEDTSAPGSKFFDTSFRDGGAILEYNVSHRFFEYINELLEGLLDPDDDTSPEFVSDELKIMIDLMIISYARAEGNFADDQMMKAEQYRDMMRNYWGQFLLSYINFREAEQG